MPLVSRIKVRFLITRWQPLPIFLVVTLHITVDFTVQEETAGGRKNPRISPIGYRLILEGPLWCVLWPLRAILMEMSGWLTFLCRFHPTDPGHLGYIPRIHRGTRKQVHLFILSFWQGSIALVSLSNENCTNMIGFSAKIILLPLCTIRQPCWSRNENSKLNIVLKHISVIIIIPSLILFIHVTLCICLAARYTDLHQRFTSFFELERN